MKLFKNIFIFFLTISIGLVGCQKDSFVPDNYFETSINNTEKTFVPKNANIYKGITIIAALETKKDLKKAIIITINGDQIGKYKQTFDYKTGVSVSQCGLTYKIISKLIENTPSFYNSYEGNVEITEIDNENKKISGSYNFKLHSVPDNNKPYVISGKFVKLSFD